MEKKESFLREYRISVTSIDPPTREDERLYGRCHAHGFDLSKLELHQSLQGIEPTPGEKTVVLKEYDQVTTSQEQIAWAFANGYRPAFPCETLAFVRQHPHVQQKGSEIVDLGSFIRRPHWPPSCLVLDYDAEGDDARTVSLIAHEREYHPHTLPCPRFLFVCL